MFPPTFRELNNPQLELFDLDEAFSSEKARLSQITNKCTDDDIEYYVREAADILGKLHKTGNNSYMAEYMHTIFK